jgi:DNA-binding PadR family transcriptional regulator
LLFLQKKKKTSAWELLTEQNPKQCYPNLSDKERKKFVEGSELPAGLWKLLRKCCKRNPTARPEFQEIEKKMRQLVDDYDLRSLPKGHYINILVTASSRTEYLLRVEPQENVKDIIKRLRTEGYFFFFFACSFLSQPPLIPTFRFLFALIL